MNHEEIIRTFNITVRYTDLPNKAVCVKLLDGYCLLVDQNLSKSAMQEAIEHEFWHLILGHLDDRSDLPVTQKEQEVEVMMKVEI